MTEISIDIIKKVYPETHTTPSNVVIKNLHLNIKQNEFVCVVGPSGCGKTTLMNIVAGIDQDYTGNTNLGEHHSAAPKVGYMFQEPRLLPWCTVIKNIELVLENNHKPKLVDALLEMLEITSIQHHYPKQISLGMARRVALARAFIIEPDILLMDEPFVSLDMDNAKRIRENLVATWLTQQHSILFVTHDIREAIYLADRIVVLSHVPTTVIDEITVTLSRQQRNKQTDVEQFRQSIIKNHPAIAHYC